VVDHPRRVVDGLSFFIKFQTDLVYSFGDIATFIFWQFGLKIPIHATLGWGFAARFPQMMSLIILTPKKTVFGLNYVI